MTTIDVNTGGFVGGRSFDDTIFKTNLEAAQVIARQLRMRNLGGIIIIDFIDMENVDHRDAVLAELDKALERDRTRLTVNGFTQLGLVEMTRKRTRESLAHVLCEPCPTCDGRGELKTAQTICYEILREILREAKQFNAREFRILASQSVIDMFLDEESQSLAQLGDFIGKPISLQVETALHAGAVRHRADLTEHRVRAALARFITGDMKRLWLRIEVLLARLLERVSTRLFRREPAPGRFETGSVASPHGRVTARRWPPARDYLVYVPRGLTRWRRAPLLVLCHGCRQTPEEIAQRARIAERADRAGLARAAAAPEGRRQSVALLELVRRAHRARRRRSGDRRGADRQRAARVIARTRARGRRGHVGRRRAGRGARRAPSRASCAACFVHSGLACGAASSAVTALRVMKQRAGQRRRGDRAMPREAPSAMFRRCRSRCSSSTATRRRRRAAQRRRRSCDSTCASTAIPRAARGYSAGAPLPAERRDRRANLPATARDAHRRVASDGRVVVRHVLVEGLGHAWSGGDAAFAVQRSRGRRCDRRSSHASSPTPA